MKNAILFSLILGVLATACTKKTAAGQQISEEEAYQNFQSQKNDGKHFGEFIDTKGAISYDELVKKMQKSDKVQAKVIGEVKSVCQTKGCWMQVSSATAASPMFVQFKDYAFFMPKNLSGSKVVMKGEAYYSITTVEELRHFAEDEGKSQAEIEAIKSPLKELKFMASGVTILD